LVQTLIKFCTLNRELNPEYNLNSLVSEIRSILDRDNTHISKDHTAEMNVQLDELLDEN